MKIFRGEPRREGTAAYKPKQKLLRLYRRRARLTRQSGYGLRFFPARFLCAGRDRSRPPAGLETRISRADPVTVTVTTFNFAAKRMKPSFTIARVDTLQITAPRTFVDYRSEKVFRPDS